MRIWMWCRSKAVIASLVITVVLTLSCTSIVSAQSLQLHVDSQQNQGFLKKIYTDSLNNHTSIWPYLDQEQAELASPALGRKGWVYRKLFQEHLFQLKKEGVELTLDFEPDFQLGYEKEQQKRTWLNTRGIVVQGRVGTKFSFYTDFYENQSIVAPYMDRYMMRNRVAPGQGSLRLNIGLAYDYSYSNGHVSYSPSKHFHFQLGHGKNAFGDGYRSMLLSDQAFNYPFLKIITDVWKIRYVNLFAEFQDLRVKRTGDQVFDKKYGAFHYLDFAVTKRFTFSLFESIIWAGADSIRGYRGFDLNYLSPIIFYRPVEFSVGSPDNALMGLGGKYRISKKISAYGQFLLDEFKLKEYQNNRGWWANKYGYQLGFRYFDVLGVENLNLLSELNAATPYTYSQRSTATNYGHYNEALAHPLGANFRESVSILNYRKDRISFRLQFNYAYYGKDTTGNIGKDIYKLYTTRDREYGNYLGQGLKTQLYYWDARIAYVINPKTNLRVEFGLIDRTETNVKATERDVLFTFGLRSTFRNLYADF